MDAKYVISLLTSFFGAGIPVAVSSWLLTNRTARHERQTSWLIEQLRSLYGPLSFFTRQNEELFKLATRIQAEFEAYFTGRWSENEAAQQSLVEGGAATTNLGNMYAERVLENNARVMEILERNWHLVDLEETEVFARFQVHHTRFLTEVKQRGRDKVPMKIIMNLGPIPMMHPR